MRIRAALTAVALGVALTAAGASSAFADDGHHRFGGDDPVCSPYFGAIDHAPGGIVWGGVNCHDDF
ncbi:hypothetical protein [Streptomyces resistomycificus]|uniref:Uncharacterized protein n=1 Tax=Streptomyces resistomycificus TaxID=67356 RepID=A0A0L8LMA4_9ACTN|nr:hypothetical protein [Streptomyces resistomycificus]KOG39234.1 hypothetical protein ADK37_09380 [Streptomyces resistomycificus]KUN99834.1 hypothetical protein AQJ84_10475 [Streptomyces resistomycificus]